MGGSHGGDLPCGNDTCDSFPPAGGETHELIEPVGRSTLKFSTVARTLPGSAIRRPRWDTTPPGPLLCGTGHLGHHLLALLAWQSAIRLWHAVLTRCCVNGNTAGPSCQQGFAKGRP